MSEQSYKYPYNGTIYTAPDPNIATDITEFYRFPLKERNEIVISVKASTDAHIVLFDGSKSSDASDKKVQVVIGGDRNSSASIGSAKPEDDANYPKMSVQKGGLLSATHFKSFTVRWFKGRVHLYNEGFEKPFLSWNGPNCLLVSHVGVRTVGASGEWRVQGMPILKTADTTEYKEIEVNTGRLDFEVKAPRDCYLMFTPEPKATRNPCVHYVMAYGAASSRNGWWVNNAETAPVDFPKKPLNMNEYRKFWVKWDAHNLMAGVDGSNVADVALTDIATALPILRYFGLQSAGQGQPGYNNGHAYWHILDTARPEDLAGNSDTASGGEVVSTTTDNVTYPEQMGYVSYSYVV